MTLRRCATQGRVAEDMHGELSRVGWALTCPFFCSPAPVGQVAVSKFYGSHANI